jgi:hypothetical protein
MAAPPETILAALHARLSGLPDWRAILRLPQTKCDLRLVEIRALHGKFPSSALTAKVENSNPIRFSLKVAGHS